MRATGLERNLGPERCAAGILRLVAELLLDAQELVVLGGAVGAGERAGLDLPAIGGDRQVGNGRILGLAGAMRHHRREARLMGHLDRGSVSVSEPIWLTLTRIELA